MTDFLYNQLSKEIGNAIRQGVYGINERMPSLRRITQLYKVSLATAIQSYRILEDEGLIEARPRSGYFVKSRQIQYHAEPETTRPSSRPTSISVGQLALSLISETQSEKLIKFGAAVPGEAFLPVKALSRCLAGVARRYANKPAVYESAKGTLALRRQIAQLMRQAGCRCTPDDIVITNGCLEALSLSLRVIAKPGDTIAIESPTYFAVLQVIESLGMKALEIATHPVHGIDTEALETAVKKRNISACILMPNFHNPLGSQMPDENKKRVAKLLGENNIPLIEDDVYGSLSYQQPRPKALKAFDKNDNVLLCSSFSKILAPGYRIGWVLSKKYNEQIEYRKFLENISTATLPQLALADFLSRGGFSRNIQQVVPVYRHRMEMMRRLISEYFPANTRISQPAGGFVLWLALAENIDCLDLYKLAMTKQIAISPGILFSARGEFRNHIRLSCAAVDEAQMKTALKTLGQLIHQFAKN